MGVYFEKTMEQLNSGELKIFFRNIHRIVLIGLIASGKRVWQEEEETRKDTSTVLILQQQLCISELFKDIQAAILLILHHRTMYLFRTISSSTFIILDVQSIYTPLWIQDWYQEDTIWAKDRRYSSRLWILPCPMCNQFAFYHQFWINTWRSKFEQQTDSILSACGSHGQESQGSWYDRFECTAPCTLHA